MLRFGLALSKANRPFLAPLLPSLSNPTILCKNPGTSIFQRSYAKKDSTGIKKQKYSAKDGTGKPKQRQKSGLRKKRGWLDTPRNRKVVRKRLSPAKLLATLNTDKRITKHVKKLSRESRRGASLNQSWLRYVSNQGRISVPNAEMLTRSALNSTKRAKFTPKTYTSLLTLWRRRKNLTQATAVFDVAREESKLDDTVYGAYTQCLVKEGKLDEAKKMIDEHPCPQVFGALFNYVAANDLNEGLSVFNQLAQPSTAEFSEMIGYCLKHGEPEKADELWQRMTQQHVTKGYHPCKDDAEYDLKIKEVQEREAQIRKMAEDWETTMRKADEGTKDIKTALKKGMLKRRPKFPARLPYPIRYSEKEFLEKHPVRITSHVLRPLVDMDVEGKEVDEAWQKTIAAGMGSKKVLDSIKRLARALYRTDLKRYQHMKNALRKLGLDYEELTRIPAAKPTFTGPPERKRTGNVVKKWWKMKVEGQVEEEAEAE